MKIAELESGARERLAVAEVAKADEEERDKQRVIALLATELDLDKAELQEIVSICPVRCDTRYKMRAGSLHDHMKIEVALNVPEHKAVIFTIENTRDRLHLRNARYYVDGLRVEFWDLGAALVCAADEWVKEIGGSEIHDS